MNGKTLTAQESAMCLKTLLSRSVVAIAKQVGMHVITYRERHALIYI